MERVFKEPTMSKNCKKLRLDLTMKFYLLFFVVSIAVCYSTQDEDIWRTNLNGDRNCRNVTPVVECPPKVDEQQLCGVYCYFVQRYKERLAKGNRGCLDDEQPDICPSQDPAECTKFCWFPDLYEGKA